MLSVVQWGDRRPRLSLSPARVDRRGRLSYTGFRDGLPYCRPWLRRRCDDGHSLRAYSRGGQAPSPVALVGPRGQARAPVLHRISRRSPILPPLAPSPLRWRAFTTRLLQWGDRRPRLSLSSAR